MSQPKPSRNDAAMEAAAALATALQTVGVPLARLELLLQRRLDGLAEDGTPLPGRAPELPTVLAVAPDDSIIDSVAENQRRLIERVVRGGHSAS